MKNKEQYQFDVKFSVLWNNSLWLVVRDYRTALREAQRLKKRHPQDDIILRISISNDTDEQITL